MYTRISSETNNYARQRIQNVTGHLLDFYLTFTQHVISSIFTRFLLDFYSTLYFFLNSFLFLLLFVLVIILGGRDPIQLIDQPNYQKHHRLSKWTNINESDLKIFLGHVIIMGLVCKPTITKYWHKNEMCNTPFFGQYMTRTQFEMILANIHIVDNTYHLKTH